MTSIILIAIEHNFEAIFLLFSYVWFAFLLNHLNPKNCIFDKLLHMLSEFKLLNPI